MPADCPPWALVTMQVPDFAVIAIDHDPVQPAANGESVDDT